MHRLDSNQDHADTPALRLVRDIPLIDAAGDWGSFVIEQIVVKLSIASAELQLFQEKRVVL